MAKGKQSKSGKYTSKGERRSSMKTSGHRSILDRMIAQMNALEKGKDIVVVDQEPYKTKGDGKRPFFRKRINGQEYLKSMKTRPLIIKGA